MGGHKPRAPAGAKPRRPRRRKAEPASSGLSPAEVANSEAPEGATLAEAVRTDGGVPLAVYRDPLGGHPVVLAALPLDKVEPTPYQRDVSEPHVKRLANAMERVGRFLDPLIAVRHDGRYWTPNGNHRLHALQLLGARSAVALVLPDPQVAYQILALNTEKAHNLKERSLEVIRMYRGLVPSHSGLESEHAPLFEEPSFATFGAAYEQRPRYAAGAYGPIVRRVDGFLDLPLPEALRVREARAQKLLELDDVVSEAVSKLKARGLSSPYLKNFVVARVNFLRFKKDGPFDFDQTLARVTDSARRLDASKVKQDDLAKMGGAPPEGGEE